MFLVNKRNEKMTLNLQVVHEFSQQKKRVFSTNLPKKFTAFPQGEEVYMCKL